jgi:hypothetical protein
MNVFRDRFGARIRTAEALQTFQPHYRPFAVRSQGRSRRGAISSCPVVRPINTNYRNRVFISENQLVLLSLHQDLETQWAHFDGVSTNSSPVATASLVGSPLIQAACDMMSARPLL